MKKSLQIFIVSLLVLIFSTSCVDDVGENWKTFEGELVYSYLENDSSYSEFVEVLKRAGLKGMLSSYATFTCFAPTNDAMCLFYRMQGDKFTIDSLRPEQLDTLAKSHIVSGTYHTQSFGIGVLPSYNLSYDFLEVKFDVQKGGILINDSSRIVSKDNIVYNGVVHGINRVLKLMINRLPELMAKNSDISIFNKALYLTSLSDSINPIVDLRNNPPLAHRLKLSNFDFSLNDIYPYLPQRKFGYTVFVEDNELLKKHGINSLDDLIQRAKQLYPGHSEYDNDYTHRNNSLNRYMAYHIINRAIYYNKFFYTRNAINGYTPDEFLETMLPNRIIRVANVHGQVVLNPESDYEAVVQEAYDQRTKNGVYHLLDHPLVYSNRAEQVLQSVRIRFDVASLLPELTNNNIRGNPTTIPESEIYYPYFYFEPGYLSNIKAKAQTHFMYLNSRAKEIILIDSPNFQGDALYAEGEYDFTIRLLPVPPGTYELRFGGSASGKGDNTVQIYVDNIPVGIPLRIGIDLDGRYIKNVLDSETKDNGVKFDQLLRYKGYMKGPSTHFYRKIPGFDGNPILITARDWERPLRKIVGEYSFTDYQPHTIRFKKVTQGYGKFGLDYFELVPKSVFNPPGDDVYETRD